MTKYGYCPSCNNTFSLEDRVVGKLIGVGLIALAAAVAGRQVAKNPLVFVGLNFAGLALAHSVDTRLGFRCPTPGCSTILRVVDGSLNCAT